ncbi:APC family permease [Amycolatopsis sp. NPDC059021]|uniref:APC family permease n=1 Tax=Amycolatopsis sp. NPDC059021 TaxID=3346704 RepID=UPI00366F6141
MAMTADPPPAISTSTAAGSADTGTEPGPRRLPRSIGVFGGTLLTLSCLTPASSLFVVVPPLLALTGTGAALTIVLAGVLCVAVAFCYAEMGTLVPSAGGEYAMVGTVAGRFSGWLMFALSFVVVLVIPPIFAVGTAGYLAPVLDVDKRVVGVVVMLLGTLMGLLNLRANAWITGIFLCLEVVAAGVVAFLGFAHTQRPASVLVQPTLAEPGQGSVLGPVTIIAGLAVALFVLQGFTTAIYLSEEMRTPRRTVVRTVLWTLAAGALVVLVPVVAIVLGAPDTATLAAGDVAAMVTGWSTPAVGVFVSLAIAIAIVNAVVVMVIQNSRVLYASARDRAWPDGVNRVLGTIGARFSSPWPATLVVGVSGAVLCLVPIATLNGVTSVVVAALYLGVVAATLAARRGQHRQAPAWRMWGWPVLPVLTAVVLLYVLSQQKASDLVITLAVVLLAAGYWRCYLRPRTGERWVVTVPEN